MTNHTSHYLDRIPSSSIESASTHSSLCHHLDSSTRASKSGWKPWTFSNFTLFSMLASNLVLLFGIGLLEWISYTHGALLLAPTVDWFTPTQTFLFRYLPVIVIVVYGIAWGWLDLDIKRLEPWFQLSRGCGVRRSDSLDLQYPVEFFALVPFLAAKRRHVAVFSISVICLCISLGIAPLQNGIFVSRIMTFNSTVAIASISALMNPSQQVISLSTNFLNDGYAMLWLQQELPAFTTTEFALMPFTPARSSMIGSNQTIAAATTMYGTDLTCNPPAFAGINGSGGLSFDDGEGCVFSLETWVDYGSSLDNLSMLRALYYGYYNDSLGAPQSFAEAGCPEASKHKFLAIWKHASDAPPDFSDPNNATALFCETSYYKQAVMANVTMSNGSVLNIQEIGVREPLTEAEFNITHFEYILTAGLPPTTDLVRDVSDRQMVDFSFQYSNMSILGKGNTNMVGFAIGSTKLSKEAYFQPTVLADAYQKAHRLLFALALQRIFVQTPEVEVSNAQTTFSTSAVTISFPFAVMMQVLLLITTSIFSFLLFQLQRRSSSLQRDPDCLSELMSLSNEPALRQGVAQVVSSIDAPSARQTDESLFSLRYDTILERPVIRTVGSEETLQETKFLNQKSETEFGTTKVIQPWEYKWFTAFGLALVLAALLSVLAVLYVDAKSSNGLDIPNANDLVLQLFTNILPVLVTSSLEPLWVLLSRVACVTMPLERLSKGPAAARESLLLKYTALPPQLVIPQAIRNRHFVLAALSFVALTSNVLSVAISGLFSVKPVDSVATSFLEAIYLPRFDSNSSDIREQVGENTPFYSVSSNLSSNVPLPAWTIPTHFFLPRLLDQSQLSVDGSRVAYNVNGFTGNLTCKSLSATSESDSISVALNMNATTLALVANIQSSDNTTLRCQTVPASRRSGSTSTTDSSNSVFFPQTFGRADYINASDGMWNLLDYDAYGLKTVQVFNQMEAVTTDDQCSDYYLVGIIRANNTFTRSDDTPSDEFGILSNSDISGIFLACQTSISATPHTIEVDRSGKILSAAQTGPSFSELPASVNISQVMTDLNLNLLYYNRYGWSNKTFNTWPGYLASKLANTSSLIDPTLPLPSADALATIMSEVYARAFAVQGSLYTSYLLQDSSNSTVLASLLIPTRRIFLDPVSFKICMSLLSFQLLVAIVFFATRPRPFLQKMPTNIASQIELFAWSRVADDVAAAASTAAIDAEDDSDYEGKERKADKYVQDLRSLDDKGWRYMYGKFIGSDGSVHVGIERASVVTQLNDCNFYDGRRGVGKWFDGLRNRRRHTETTVGGEERCVEFVVEEKEHGFASESGVIEQRSDKKGSEIVVFELMNSSFDHDGNKRDSRKKGRDIVISDKDDRGGWI